MRAAGRSPKGWWHQKENAVRFQCQGSGKCCVTHGQYGHVYLTLADRRRLAKHLGLSTSVFTRTLCSRDAAAGGGHVYRLKDGRLKDGNGPDCIFLEGKRCGVYEGRPEQCRTWPFWPEVMNAKKWAKEVASFCPGVGKGPKVDPLEIDALLKQQADWEERLVSR